MRTQHEFCFFACSKNKVSQHYVSSLGRCSKWRLSRTVEHLALGAETVTLCHQVVNLLASLQYTLDGLVQNNLGLVELLLDLHDAIGLLGILVLGQVVLELGHDELWLTRGP